jgi:hypothetical protein
MDAKSHILLNQGKIKIKVDKRISPEKCSKVDYGDLTKGYIELFKRAKVTISLNQIILIFGKSILKKF